MLLLRAVGARSWISMGQPAMYADALRHSHSIVNSRSRFRGKARCFPGENGPDTDRSTVAFESPSLESLLSISLIDGS